MANIAQVCPGYQDANKMDKTNTKKRLHTIEARFIQAYEKELIKGGTTASLAKRLNCSESYVRMMYKHHQLPPLKPSHRPWGGARPGAGRKNGSRNKDPMLQEQYCDNKTNSVEVGIFSNVTVTKRDIWQYTQSLRSAGKENSIMNK